MDPLEQLKDIHLPDEVGIWPLAYGWWIVIALLMLALAFGLYRLYKRYQYKMAIREAHTALDKIDSNAPEFAFQAQKILKRLMISYFPDQNLSSRHGEAWLDTLMSLYSGKNSDDIRTILSDVQQQVYQPADKQTDNQKAKTQIKHWIENALPPSKAQREELNSV